MSDLVVYGVPGSPSSAEFMTGDSISIADLMLVTHLAFFRGTPEGEALMRETSLESWLTRMAARPSMQTTEAERLRHAA
jgi:glutathione S-transferase